MCGISGILAFNDTGKTCFPRLPLALSKLHKRGPDAQHTYYNEGCALGHCRLSVIDTSVQANQPFVDVTGRYALVFNGEIYNYKLLKSKYLPEQVFRTQGDTEVLLYMLITYGTRCLDWLHGFFAFCFVDTQTQKALLVRDRYGKKPLVYYKDRDKLLFASEIKALESFDLALSLNKSTVYTYFKYTYNPSSEATIYNEVHKLPPGTLCEVAMASGVLTLKPWYVLPQAEAEQQRSVDYAKAQQELYALVETAVVDRLEADVPVGAFLSGGIDSSIVVALASKHIAQLNTFSIGFKDNPFFDETYYSDLVAQQFGTKHHKIMLDNNSLLECVHDVLEYIDEPFADSSALALYVLSRETKVHATVALSGDGADEVFGGYNKYRGLLTLQRLSKWLPKETAWLSAVLKILPSSRSGVFSNTIRQVSKLVEGIGLDAYSQYLRFSAIHTDVNVRQMFSKKFLGLLNMAELDGLEAHFAHKDLPLRDINDVLWRDQQLVLPNDMLIKADLMSMANSLELRCPFLDHRVTEFANQLPVLYKIGGGMKKRILQDTFRHLLPQQLYNRPKKGFDVPMITWFQKELNTWIFDELLEKEYIERQGIFEYDCILELKKKLFSLHKGDVQAQLWSLIVFQYWYKKRFDTHAV